MNNMNKKIKVIFKPLDFFNLENMRKYKVFHVIYDSLNLNILWLGTEHLILVKPVSEEELRLTFSELIGLDLEFCES